MVLKIIDEGQFIDIPINAGEIFLLPPKVLHSPQRSENSVGMVVEQKRLANQRDALHWFCQHCQHPLYQESFCLDNIEKDLPKVFNNFYNNSKHCTCTQCGAVMTKPSH